MSDAVPGSSSSSNQNVNNLQRSLDVLTGKVDTILQGFEMRLSRVELRMDKIEEQGRASLQSSHEAHAAILRETTASIQETERRILDKLGQRDRELKETEIRLNVKLEENQRDRAGRTFALLLNLGGWLVALVTFLISYLHPH